MTIDGGFSAYLEPYAGGQWHWFIRPRESPHPYASGYAATYAMALGQLTATLQVLLHGLCTSQPVPGVARGSP